MGKTWQWQKWPYRLIPLLTGKALEAYTAMDEGVGQFWHISGKISSTVSDHCNTVRGDTNRDPPLAEGSLSLLDASRAEDQGATSVPRPDIRTWVQELEPEDGLTVAKLAMQYLTAKKGVASWPIWVETRDYNRPRDNFLTTSEGNRG